MSPFEKVALLATFMSAANCFLLSVIERNVRKRLDEQAMRLAEIENAIGLAPLFPLDVECPICGAGRGEFCHGAKRTSHSARFDVSPGARRNRT